MNKIILSMVLLSLCACGFKLKGVPPLQALSGLHWQVSGGGLQQALETAMRHALGKPLVFSGVPEVEIRVLNVDSKKDVYTITRAAKLNEYLLSLRVQAQAFRHGKVWGEPMQIDVRRTMPYADSLVLGKIEEEHTIWQEMRQDAAEQIVRRLAFLPHDSQTTGQSSWPR